jgi:uncharacterized protein YqjF (DUF2071 family)
MTQRWHDLLFADWQVEPGALVRAVPAPLELDLCDGSAWLGVIPFTMSGVRLRGTPALPGASAFPELNVRTYVRYRGLEGVFFFSLDAGNRIAVAAARRWYRLPYYRARMVVRRRDGAILYRSRRIHRAAPEAELDVTYAPAGDPFCPAPGSLDRWLVERYRLFSVWGGRVLTAEILHPVWSLRPASAEFRINTMTEGLGLALPAEEPRLAFAHRQEVKVWPPADPHSN